MLINLIVEGRQNLCTRGLTQSRAHSTRRAAIQPSVVPIALLARDVIIVELSCFFLPNLKLQHFSQVVAGLWISHFHLRLTGHHDEVVVVCG